MTPESAAARLSVALLPGRRAPGRSGGVLAINALAAYARFAREVVDEAGPVVLADIVREVELHAPITRGAA